MKVERIPSTLAPGQNFLPPSNLLPLASEQCYSQRCRLERSADAPAKPELLRAPTQSSASPAKGTTHGGFSLPFALLYCLSLFYFAKNGVCCILRGFAEGRLLLYLRDYVTSFRYFLKVARQR